MIRSLTEINWVVVNANGTPDAVFEELNRHVQATIEECEDKPVSVLFCVFK